MSSKIAGLMEEPKYKENIIRTGDIKDKAPFTLITGVESNLSIQLPLPVNLNSAMGADWQQQEMGAVGGLTRTLSPDIKSIWDAGSLTDMAVKLDSILGDKILQSSEDVKALKARTLDSKSKVSGAKFAMNPRNEMMFSGMQFKSYNFTFMLLPYKEKDTQNITDVIKEIQYASAPALRGQKMILEYPETWNIKFMDGEDEGNDHLMKINECCCTNVGVNYTPQSDSSVMHKKNAPLAVELTLDFTEIIIPSKETIDEGFYG